MMLIRFSLIVNKYIINNHRAIIIAVMLLLDFLYRYAVIICYQLSDDNYNYK